jgi:hypothetical protein
LPELDSEALDFRVASELFASVRRLKPRDLETFKLIRCLDTGGRFPRGQGDQVILDLEEDELSGKIAISKDHKEKFFAVYAVYAVNGVKQQI